MAFFDDRLALPDIYTGHHAEAIGAGVRTVKLDPRTPTHQPLSRWRRAYLGVRRDKAALSSGCKPHPAIRSSRKQPEQAWRRRNV